MRFCDGVHIMFLHEESVGGGTGCHEQAAGVFQNEIPKESASLNFRFDFTAERHLDIIDGISWSLEKVYTRLVTVSESSCARVDAYQLYVVACGQT